jgi:putative oxidoreductase
MEVIVSGGAGAVVLAGRLLFAIFFAAVAGVSHIRMSAMFEGGARAGGFPVPSVAGWPTGVWLVAAGLSIALGVWPDVGALMVAVFVVLAGAWFHRFWRIEDQAQRRMQQQLFWRNAIALGAALLMFGAFAAFGDALRFTLTAPLFTF